MGIERKRRSVAIAKISEYQAQIFPSGITIYANLASERFLLRGLLCALTRPVEQPSVIYAADAVAFDPTSGELRPSMRAAKSHNVGRSGLATIESEALAHDLDGFSLAGAKLFGPMYGMPEPAHEPSSKTPGPGRDEIFIAKFFTVTFLFGWCHKILSR
jgi:hypothetical protein